MKKLISIVLTFSLVLSMVTMAFADTEGPLGDQSTSETIVTDNGTYVLTYVLDDDTQRVTTVESEDGRILRATYNKATGDVVIVREISNNENRSVSTDSEIFLEMNVNDDLSEDLGIQPYGTVYTTTSYGGGFSLHNELRANNRYYEFYIPNNGFLSTKNVTDLSTDSSDSKTAKSRVRSAANGFEVSITTGDQYSKRYAAMGWNVTANMLSASQILNVAKATERAAATVAIGSSASTVEEAVISISSILLGPNFNVSYGIASAVVSTQSFINAKDYFNNAKTWNAKIAN